jgi:hypothetical protein
VLPSVVAAGGGMGACREDWRPVKGDALPPEVIPLRSDDAELDGLEEAVMDELEAQDTEWEVTCLDAGDAGTVSLDDYRQRRTRPR